MTEPVITKALDLLALSDENVEVFPGLDGEVAVAFYKPHHLCLEVIIREDGLFDIRHEQGLGFQYTDVIEPIDGADEPTARQHIEGFINHPRTEGGLACHSSLSS